MFGFLSNSEEDNVILIDIGNGTITGGLSVYNKNSKPTFYFCVKKYFSTTDKLEIKKFENETISLLDEVINQIIRQGFSNKYFKSKSKKIKNVLVSFSSPWFLSKSKNIELSNDKEFVITKAFLDDILNKEVLNIENELERDGGEQGLEVIEKSIINSKINGYVLDNSIGKNTKSFNASLYISVIGKEFVHKVVENIHKHTHISSEKIIIHTFPLILFTVIRDLFSRESNFLLMDVTGEVTDITLIKDDIIEKSASMPSGRNFIIRQIARTLSVSNEIAESTLQLYITGKLNDELNSKVNDILAGVEREWSIYLENALLEIAPDMALPNSVFITADGDVSHIYTNFLTVQKLDSTGSFRKNIKVSQIDLEKLKDFYENFSGTNLDEFIVILSLFYKKLLTK